MNGFVYKRVSADWHHLRTPAGMFFARSKAEAFRKAGLIDSASDALAFSSGSLADDRQRALQEFAREQQQAALAASEVRKGMRHVL